MWYSGRGVYHGTGDSLDAALRNRRDCRDNVHLAGRLRQPGRSRHDGPGAADGRSDFHAAARSLAACANIHGARGDRQRI